MSRNAIPAGFGALWVTVAVDLVGFGIVIPILPLYADRFDASPAVIGVLLASFSLAQFAASPVWGRLSDRAGRKPVLIASLAGSAIGSILTAFAPNLELLFLGRLVDGASGGSVAVAQAAAADLAAPDERARLIGLLGAAYGIGFVVGPALGGLAGLVGPRAPFVVAAVIAATNALVACRRLPETRQPNRSTRRPPAAPRIRLPSLLAAGFLATAAFGAFEATFALLAAHRLNLGAPMISAVFFTAGLLIAATNTRGVVPAVRRLGAHRTMRVGWSITGFGLLLLSAAGSIAVLVPAIAMLAVGHGLAMPSLTTAIANSVPLDERGAALGAQQSAASLARVAGPLAAGALFATAGSAAPFITGAALAGAAAVAVRGRGDEIVDVATLAPVQASAGVAAS